ncbi:MAG: hypothetical protein ABIQ88_02320 [Chitinophagaceae bacterium]
MKQVRITISTPLWTIAQTFAADAVTKQLAFINKAKKNFAAATYTGKEPYKLSCNIEQLNTTAPLPAAINKPVNEVQPAAAPVMALVKAQPLKIKMENRVFVFYPKRRYFLAADNSAQLSMKEARGLYDYDLLQINKLDLPTFRSLVNA